MSIGLGIFLSSVFVGSILLYNSTKDRWDWRKNIWRMVKLALVVITVLGIGGTFYWFYSTLPEEPQVKTEYWGFSQ